MTMQLYLCVERILFLITLHIFTRKSHIISFWKSEDFSQCETPTLLTPLLPLMGAFVTLSQDNLPHLTDSQKQRIPQD